MAASFAKRVLAIRAPLRPRSSLIDQSRLCALVLSRPFVNFSRPGQGATEREIQEEASRKRRVQELRERISRYSLSDPVHLRAVFATLLSRTSLDSDVVSFSSQALAIGSYATAALIVAGTLGIDTTPLLALAGSTGVALGFALRDFVSNVLSGVIAVVHSPKH
jgi:hypothetical protein